jgi:uncharacterized cupin superfamily protein
MRKGSDMPATNVINRSSIDTGTYEPFNGFEAIVHGEPAARVAWLRTSSGGEGVLYAGMFTAQPSTFVYRFAGDETFHVLDGELDVTLEGGEQVSLHPGDIVSFPKGARSTWTCTHPSASSSSSRASSQ